MKTVLSKIYFALGSLILIAVQTVELLFMTETETGFFKQEFLVFRVIFAVLTALVCVGFYFSAKSCCKKSTPDRITVSVPLAVISLITAFGFLIGNAVQLTSLTRSALVEMGLSVLAAIFFLVFGLCGVFRVNVPKILSVFTLPYFVYALISTFARNSEISLIPENSYETLLFCSLVLFFLVVAKFICGIEKEKNFLLTVSLGFVSAMFCFVCTVPRYIIILIGKSAVLKTNTYPNIFIFIIGIFITAFCFNALKKPPQKPRNLFIPNKENQRNHNQPKPAAEPKQTETSEQITTQPTEAFKPSETSTVDLKTNTDLDGYNNLFSDNDYFISND